MKELGPTQGPQGEELVENREIASRFRDSVTAWMKGLDAEPDKGDLCLLGV